MQTVLMLLFGLLTLIAVSLQRTYSRIPLKELKHRARHDDQLAAAMLRASGYGHSLRAVLWFLIALTSASFFVAVSRATPLWFALAASGVLVWISFVWLPAARITSLSERLAAIAAPVLSKVVGFLNPFIERITRIIRKYRPVQVHTGLYDRQDLVDLLDRQLVQPDNRIEKSELEIALHALTFGDDTVGQHLTPRRVVKAVSIDDPLGPIVMDELHKSGHSRFPVYDGHADNMVGTLYLRDLIHARANGTVKDLMKHGVAYVHEDQSLHDALQAILRTHRQLFVVVNSFEEYVGIITIEDILETILGKPIIDEFDQYDDLRAVAARSARKEHSEHSSRKHEELAEKNNKHSLEAASVVEEEPEFETELEEDVHADEDELSVDAYDDITEDEQFDSANDVAIADDTDFDDQLTGHEAESQEDIKEVVHEEGAHVDLSKSKKASTHRTGETEERKRIVHREEDIDETIEL